MHLAQELLTNIQSRGGSRSFAKETRPLKMRNVVVAIRSWQWPTERITEADPLITRWEVAEELSVDHSTVVQHLKQIGKVKKLYKWMPRELTRSQKNHHFEVSSLTLCNISCISDWESISQSDCAMWRKVDFIWQPATTSRVVAPRSSSKTPP